MHEVQPGDMYLLCSDGLNDMVEDEDIGMTLQTLQANLTTGCDAVGTDGQRQWRARQRVGHSGQGKGRLRGAARLVGAVAVLVRK